MDRQSLDDLKKQLKDFEKRLLQKEKEHEMALDKKCHPDDDLGKAREIFENIMRQLPENSDHKSWAENEADFREKIASLLILISE